MTLIEGIGDEVIHFFIGILIVIIVTLAWWTTDVTEQRSFGTVYVFRRRRTRNQRNLTSHTQSSEIIEDQNNHSNSTIESKPPEASTSSTKNPNQPTSRSEEEEIVSRMDAPTIARESRTISSDSATENVLSNHNVNIPDDSQIKKNEEQKLNNQNNIPSEENEINIEENEEPLDPETIRIKIKFLNDDLRLVTAKLQEKLGDFKQKNFQPEISLNKNVKLIFRGHVLHQDSDTLEHCGLFDNCVVHCLILHQAQSESGAGDGLNANNNLIRRLYNQQPEWNLEHYLLTILYCCLLGVWYLRYVYSEMYTVTTSVGLMLITGIFSYIMFEMHFANYFQLIFQRINNALT